MADIRINDLPFQANPNPSSRMAMDSATTEGTTIQLAVDAAVPVASESEARAGSNNSKRMTSLRVKQSLEEEVGNTIASAASGALANTAVQPEDLGDSASLNVGTTAGTVAAGDDSRIVLGGTSLQPGDIPIFDSRNTAETYDLSAFSVVRINRYTSSSVVAPAVYEEVEQPGNVEPSHAGKFQSDDGKWWEIAENPVSPLMLGAQGDGAVDDSISVKNFLELCSHTSLTGYIPQMIFAVSGVSVTLVGDVTIVCDGTFKNRDGASTSATMLTLDGDLKSSSVKWRGGRFDANGSGYTSFLVYQCDKAHVSIDETFGNEGKVDSPGSAGGLSIFDCNDVIVYPGEIYGMTQGGATAQGSVPRGLSLSNNKNAVVHGGLLHDLHGGVVLSGNKRVSLIGMVMSVVNDNGIYNVNTGGDVYSNGLVEIIDCIIDSAEEPIVHASAGDLYVGGGVISDFTNAIGIQNSGSLVLDGVRIRGRLAGSVIKTRVDSTACGQLTVRNCLIDSEPVYEAFNLSVGSVAVIEMIGNHIRWFYNSARALAQASNIFRHTAGNRFEIRDNLIEFFDVTGNIPTGNWNLVVPTVSELSSITNNRMVNRTAVSSALFRFSAARQQLVTIDDLQSFPSSQSETALNATGLTAAGPRSVWGTAAPTAGYWPAGSIVRSLTPSAGGSEGWVCVVSGTPGTWKAFGSIAA